jgi:Glyoxalase-like domain
MPRRTDTDLELDHVIVVVDDLLEAHAALQTDLGLTSIAGGRHPGWGTANRVVPLGASYLELVTVVDEPEAARSQFGRWVHDAVPRPRLLGWAARTCDLEGIARRLDLRIAAGSRQQSDGLTVRWRIGGVEAAAATPCLPFFIEWAEGTSLPGTAPVVHDAGPVQLVGLRLRGAADQVQQWLGAHRLPIRVSSGPPTISALVLGNPSAREIMVDSARLAAALG